jgi:hypothetical protein
VRGGIGYLLVERLLVPYDLMFGHGSTSRKN